MRRGEPEPGGEGTGMSPRSARAAAARGGGSPALPAERGPGRPPGAAGEGGDARGRKERDTREAAITHSLTHSQPRASSLPAPPPRHFAPRGATGAGRDTARRATGARGDPRAPAHPAKVIPSPGVLGGSGGKFSI